MDLFNLLKIIAASITVIIGFICAYVEIRKNPHYYLNWFFGLFFIISCTGFFFYTLYHIILNNATLVISFAITSQLLYHLGLACLLMTEFIIEYSEKVAITKKYLIISFGLFLIASVGYIFFPPTLNLEVYATGVVDTHTYDPWFIFVNIYRIGVLLFVVIKFILLEKKFQGRTKKQLRIFTNGMLIIIFGTILTFIGNLPGLIGRILEVFSLLTFGIGSLVILDGFLLKNESQEK